MFKIVNRNIKSDSLSFDFLMIRSVNSGNLYLTESISGYGEFVWQCSFY